MAPESFLDNIYSSKTDVWAFGILLYELYHGTSPFSHCQNNQELEKQIRIPFKKDKINIYVNE
jgi:serine/threonine protein kinase